MKVLDLHGSIISPLQEEVKKHICDCLYVELIKDQMRKRIIVKWTKGGQQDAREEILTKNGKNKIGK